MLIDPRFKPRDPRLELVLSTIGGGRALTHLGPGRYALGHWNFGDLIEHVDTTPWQLGALGDHGTCGVCDSPAQWEEVYRAIIDDPKHAYCVAFVEIRRDEQSATGGWRWHKWGPYIGTQEPKHEYLFDEDAIERVFTFHLYELEIP